jgi:hypothetical protein
MKNTPRTLEVKIIIRHFFAYRGDKLRYDKILESGNQDSREWKSR